jgi:hypothetical protein
MKKIESTYKKLLVSGCSFTHNNHHTPCTWGNNLAVWANLDIHNLGIPGAGNTHINNSIILWIEKHRPDPADVLIIVMWTGVERVDWITDPKSSKFKEYYPFTYNYSDNTELVAGGSWWSADRILQKTLVQKTLIEYTKFQNKQSLALSSWLSMTQLTDYLKQRGYTFYYTAGQDLWCPSDSTDRWIDYAVELEQLGLTLDPDPWLCFSHNEYLGNWVKEHNYLYDDGLHPSHIGHEIWCQDVLIPKLIKQNALHESSAP